MQLQQLQKEECEPMKERERERKKKRERASKGRKDKDTFTHVVHKMFMNLSLWRVKHANKCSQAFECLSQRQLELCTFSSLSPSLSLPSLCVCVAIINNQKWHKVCGISDAFASCLVCPKVLVAPQLDWPEERRRGGGLEAGCVCMAW